MTHLCQWPGCRKPVRAEHWGCAVHWIALPETLRTALSMASANGQRAHDHPNNEWRAADNRARLWALEYTETITMESNLNQNTSALPCCFGEDGKHRAGCRHARGE